MVARRVEIVMDSKEDCGVCGKPLIYSTEEVTRRCDLCGTEFSTLILCPEGHYVCDSCHSRDALDILRDVLGNTDSADPFELLERVMSHPAIPMHGPEHHAILPAVIVAAVENAGYRVPENAVEKAIQRGAKLPGGWCGSYGACGGVGVGIAVSVLTEATPLKGPERGLANAATGYALGELVDDGPRCCKRMLRKGLEAAVEFLDERMNITLVTDPPKPCRFVARNTECIRERCAYFGAQGARIKE
jgi:hypothetical protein